MSTLSLGDISVEEDVYVFPSSFFQESLWFLDQLEPNRAVYNMPSTIRLTGLLNLEVLEQVLNAIVQRHETLRTTFMVLEGQLVQVISPTQLTPLQAVDLRNLPKAEQEAAVLQLATEDAQRPFDLTYGPLLRTTLLLLGAEEHVLLLTMHHIISDEWSMGVLCQELAALYEAFLHDQPSPLPHLPIQYADFAVWQRQSLQGEALETQLSYWRQQLAEAPALLELPTDHPRPAVQTFRGARHSFVLSEKLADAFKALSRREGSTLFMTLLTAFNVLLYRYTGKADIVVGSPIANRNRPGIEGLIGFFVNTLVLRTDLSENPPFEKLLRLVREVALEAYAHQDLPFEKLVEELHPERNLSYNPLFQVMFSLQSDMTMTFDLPGLRLRLAEVENETAKFDLVLSLRDTGQGLTGSLEYNTDLFEPATMSRIGEHFQRLMEGIVANPKQPISDLPLLTEAERHQLIVEWNATEGAYPRDRRIHQLFEAQVQRTPDAVAVVFEDEHLTYRELNRRANQLAHHLQHLGIGPEVLVGLCVERSLEMVVGLLGILKAGGAYVPIDPTYPSQRVAFMLTDAGAPVLLTQQRLVAELPEHGAQIICLDTDWRTIAQQSEANPASGVGSAHLAYVIYTSGSTGKPKGVMISHQGLVNYLSWCTQAYAVAEGQGTLVHSPLGFDLTITSLFSPLLVGQKAILLPEDKGIEALQTALRNGSDFSLLKITPTHLKLLGQELSAQEAVGRARALIIGGEALLSEDISFWHTYAPGTRLINEYGPTETVVGCCVYEVPAGASLSEAIPIGRPIANTQIYILDRHLHLVPIGVPGELYIGGAGVARGYLNRPELTTEHFIHNPFSAAPDARLYKTGDLARYRSDGTIEFLGRLDHQVKIRGFRIEPGEIETVLELHPAVQQAVVVAREDAPGDKRLVAYVVQNPQYQDPDELKEVTPMLVSRLRSLLKERLPDYMLPPSFVLLDALPLTPNGKVDRRALPAPDYTRPALEEQFVAPRTTIEEVLADIWVQVLRLDRVGVHDNFFELGGDSILSIQIMARAQQAGLSLTTKHLFQYQTIAQLAAVVPLAQYVEDQQRSVSGAASLTPIQQWFFEQPFRTPHHWNQAWLLEVNQALDVVLLEQAVQHVLAHHDALCLRFKPEGIGWLQWYEERERAEVFRQVDLSGLLAAEQQAAVEAMAAEAQASLNFETGPLLRFVYFQIGSNQPARLLIIIHHLVIDGVSWRILLEDLTTAYEHLRQSKVPHLPAKTTSYQRWAQRLTEYARLATVRQELPYWLNRARTPISSLPADSTDELDANTMASARTVDVSLSAEETEALLHSVPKAYHTQINDVLLTALVQAFAQWTGERTLLVDLEGHGREPLYEEVNLSRTVGWFTTIFPVCLVLNDASPGETLKAIKEQLRHIPNHGIGYGVLRYMGEQEDSERLKALPQAQVSFNYLGQFDQMVSETGLFNIARESAGPTCDLKETRPYLLEINGLVIGGHLALSWRYNERVHQRGTIERLAEGYLEALRALIAHCQSPEAGGYTPSDFPLAKLNEQELNNLLASISQSE